jgi:hypothetical protein
MSAGENLRTVTTAMAAEISNHIRIADLPSLCFKLGGLIITYIRIIRLIELD